MDKVSLIIINYNSFSLLLRLLKSLKYIKDIIGEIIIIDNNSNEFDKLIFSNRKNIRIIINNQNIGFANAINQGITLAKNNIILSLNPDTEIIDSSIINMLKIMKKNQNIGIIGGKIIDMFTKDIRYSATSKPNFFTGLFEFTNLKKIFPNNYFSKHFWLESTPTKNELISSDSICGAFIMFRKYINRKLNLFDPNFLLYLEDVDFGLKNKKEGYEVFLYQNSVIKHIGGASTNSAYKINLFYWYTSRKYFFKKHCSALSSFILDRIFTLEEKLLNLYHHILHEPTY